MYAHPGKEYLHLAEIQEVTHLQLPLCIEELNHIETFFKTMLCLKMMNKQEESLTGKSHICLILLYETKCLCMSGGLLQDHPYICIQDL